MAVRAIRPIPVVADAARATGVRLPRSDVVGGWRKARSSGFGATHARHETDGVAGIVPCRHPRPPAWQTAEAMVPA
jgi:hypothetical protein